MHEKPHTNPCAAQCETAMETRRERYTPQVTDSLLSDMVRAIVAEVDPEQVILFGSRARGDAREDSDVDLLVIESTPFGNGRSRRREAARLYQVLSEFDISTDVLVYSRDEVEYWRNSLNNVLARALREGKGLYERP